MDAKAPLWAPDANRIAAARMTAFRQAATERHSVALENYHDLHAWSVTHRAEFWSLVWDFCGVIGDKGARAVADGDKMPGARFFPDARLNFAENLMRRHDSDTAIVFRGEDKVERRFSYTELNELV